MRDPDCVYTANPFKCSICGAWHGPDPSGIPVIRVYNAEPDFPRDAPRVDLLICPICIIAFEEASKNAPNPHFRPYTGEEMMILAAEAEEEERRFSLGLTD